MGMFFAGEEEHYVEGMKRTGFARYKHVLEGSFKELIIVGFFTLVFHIPLAAGIMYAILAKSLLIAIIAGLVGGLIAAPGFACMEDLILRRLRNDNADWWNCYKQSLRQNFKASLLPGLLQYFFIAMLSFGSALVYWGAARLSLGTIFVFVMAILFLLMILTAWWPQVVLFEQKAGFQIKNALLFCILHFFRMLGAAFLQFAWWAVMVLFMPWTALILPLLSVWFILLVANNMIYTLFDEDFRLEEQINQAYPGRLGD